MAKPPFAAQIALQYTPQQETNEGVEDVWSGLSNEAERRKAQNRVYQRAWRRRKKLQQSQFRVVKYATVESNSTSAQKLAPSETSSFSSSGSSEGSSLMLRAKDHHFSHSHSDVTQWQEADLLEAFNSAAGLSQIKTRERSRTAVACAQGNLGDSVIIEWLQKWPPSNYTIGSPRSDKLLVLVKVNVFRALISNSMTLNPI
ncbi:uncharacterized protein Bfra_008092 [Botrytis fragariae]|uniref:BZIP domain-containing protein n=1 Tax=Botrytis fragariae TaxID=1964551 RepID=A0A8H6AQD1_9HELO|nr:uncharacterized protein Bfra_008092 [Botrytis fragariae]KAF5871573.1 hypothetical protein Bfra_008092 [Botrytis fragariae]